MTQIIISDQVTDILAWQEPPISQLEIRECFSQCNPDDYQSDTDWSQYSLVGETAGGRVLKIWFVLVPQSGDIVVKNASENLEEPEAIDELASLTPEQALEVAEQSLTQAVKYKELIPSLEPASSIHLRIQLEYSGALSIANAYFCRAMQTRDPNLYQHVLTRINLLDQIDAAKQPWPRK